MRIAWLSSETPDGCGGGGQRRQFHQIRALVELGIDVTAIILCSPQSDATLREFVRVERFRARRMLRGGVDPRLLRGADAAVVAHVESLPHFEDVLRRLEIPYAVDFHNVYSRWHEVRGEKIEATRWREAERRALLGADRAFACSREEAEALLALVPSASVEVAGHGIAVDEWPEMSYEREPILAMFGSWNHEPNRDGLRWFAGEVWPRVRSEIRDAQLVLLGPGTPPTVEGARHLGRVDSLAEALGRVRVIAVPIRAGLGARVKFGEALASGAAVVSTSVGAEGFHVEQAYVRADDGLSFAQACSELLRDQEHALELGRRGRGAALASLSWSRTTQPIANWLLSTR